MEAIKRELLAQFSQGQAFCRMRYQGQNYILPVAVDNSLQLEDLLEIERQKTAVMENLQRFMQDKPYNHMLLWGARGTGKSSLIRAAFQTLAGQGLKLLQLACDDLQDLAFLLWVLAQTQDKFLIYIDDLSFSDNDDSYRALKAVLDGSIAGMAKNVMLCVTSNRRHLLSESHHSDDAIHPEEDVEEQISLAERFGLRLSFHPLSQHQYLDIVAHWALRHGLTYDDSLQQQALQFSLARGSRSARVAEQFVRQIGQ